MATSVDVTLARFSGSITTGNSITSGSFTPPNNSIIVLCIDADWSTAASGTDRAFSVAGGGLTWNSRADSGQNNGGAAIWTAPVTSGASMTIQVTMTGQATNYTTTAKAYQVTGQHASPIGNSTSGGSTTNSISPSITAAGAGRLFGAGTEWNALGAPTSTDTEDAAHFAGLISVMSAFKAADHVSGSQSINFDASGAGAADWRYALLEILADTGGGVTPSGRMGLLGAGF